MFGFLKLQQKPQQILKVPESCFIIVLITVKLSSDWMFDWITSP